MSASNAPIAIETIIVDYVSTISDNYGSKNCYFKITDPEAQTKLKPILTQKCDECRLPIWKTADGTYYMMKVKDKHVPKTLLTNTELPAKLTFKYYCIDKDVSTPIQGYFVTLAEVNETENQ
jgi:hypothetical protein